MNNELKAMLAKDLGIHDLPEEAQDQILASLGDIILRSTTTAIFERLNDEQRTQFEQLSADEDPSKIQDFLTQNVPDMPKLMEEEVKKTIARFKQAEDSVVENEII